MEIQAKIKKSEKRLSDKELENESKDELIARIRALEAHNLQLQNIITRSNKTEKKQFQNKDFDFSKCRFRHILLNFFYLGWDYQGFVTQEDTSNTVEYHLFEALTKTCLIKERSASNYNRCGRTDKGVSSLGQTISIDIRSRLTADTEHNLNAEIDYCKMLNRVLPEYIRCIGWAPVHSEFSSRFDCSGRVYKYYFPRGNLHIEKMREAAQFLVGNHDFRNFCKMDVGSGVVQFVRNIVDFRIEPLNTEDCGNEETIYVAVIEGNAFLWHQIRFIMGILLLIGAQKEEPSIIQTLLNVEDNPRKPDYRMANEIPLNLFKCQYENVVWHYSQENLALVLEYLRKIWTFKAVKLNMIEDIMKDLLKKVGDSPNLRCLSEHLLTGVKTKNYIPVMKRQKCESLEDKIEHFTKRNKIEVVPGTSNK